MNILSRKTTSRAGFTIVELLAAMISASVLALTLSVLVVYHFSAWKRTEDAVNLQRDVMVSLGMLHRMVREAGPNDVTAPRPVGEGGTAEPRLVIAGKAIYQADEADLGTADGSGTYLVYDPNTGIAGDEMVLSSDSVAAFTCTHMTSSVAIHMDIAQADNGIVTDTEVYFRNETN